MKHIFVDFEMHPISKEYVEERAICQREIIEFGAVMLDEQYKEISSFKEYVKPQYAKDICTNIAILTGITNSTLAGAKGFADVFEKFLSWCEEMGTDYTIYAWSGNDLEQMIKEIKLKHIEQEEKVTRLLENWVDFQKDYCELVKSEGPISLEKALNSVGQYFVGDMHDALYDAKNTAELFTMTRDTEEFFKVLESINEAIDNTDKDKFTFTLGDIFNFDTCQFVLL